MKIIDYGFSVYLKDQTRKLKIFCGTPSYMSPEIVLCKEYYGFPVDIWSLGVLLYCILVGRFPFNAESYPELYKKIAKGRFTVPDYCSPTLRDLLNKMLCVDVSKRYTIQQVLSHPWVMMSTNTKLSSGNAGATAHSFSSNNNNTLVSTLSGKNSITTAGYCDEGEKEIVAKMKKFGIKSDKFSLELKDKEHNYLTTTFYLLKQREIRKRSQRSEASAGVKYV